MKKPIKEKEIPEAPDKDKTQTLWLNEEEQNKEN